MILSGELTQKCQSAAQKRIRKTWSRLAKITVSLCGGLMLGHQTAAHKRADFCKLTGAGNVFTHSVIDSGEQNDFSSRNYDVKTPY